MIGTWDMAKVAAACGGTLHGANQRISAVSTDSRAMVPESLFVALRGERFDGHTYLEQAANAGAEAALVEQGEAAGLPHVTVGDCVHALGLLGQANRRRFRGPVVAITGSVGKTTIKEMVSSILSREGQTRFTQGNLNNHLGVPISLLRLDDQDQYGVFELGANHLGEIAYTASLVEADAVLVANAADAHLEGFGSREGVARGKGELFQSVRAGGTAIINRDSEYFGLWKGMARQCRQMSFGLHPEADVRFESLVNTGEGAQFQLLIEGQSLPVHLPLPGAHNVINALAAAALARSVGASFASIIDGLSQIKPVSGRLKRLAAYNGATLIDDSYNASPTSVMAALEFVSHLPGRRVAVLGPMAELGEHSQAEHERVAAHADTRVDTLLVMGEFVAKMAKTLIRAEGLVVSSHEEAVTWLRENTHRGDHVLVKGSRSATMEKIVRALCPE